MSLRRWSYYRESDGLFISQRRSTNNAQLVSRTAPDGCIAIEGHYDRFTQRFDIASGKVVADPSLAAERDACRRQQRALTGIAELERRQARAMRELAIDPDNAEASQRLRDLDGRIAKLRAELVS
jgi:hypothetical protein